MRCYALRIYLYCNFHFAQIMSSAKHGTEGTMNKLVSNMPEVAYRALSNCVKSVGHPDTKEHWVRYSFMCLQNQGRGKLIVDDD
jgi:desulfoferrodoxin (superoxide reductase-like protein)